MFRNRFRRYHVTSSTSFDLISASILNFVAKVSYEKTDMPLTQGSFLTVRSPKDN